jgi:hypothetical protein
MHWARKEIIDETISTIIICAFLILILYGIIFNNIDILKYGGLLVCVYLFGMILRELSIMIWNCMRCSFNRHNWRYDTRIGNYKCYYCSICGKHKKEEVI